VYFSAYIAITVDQEGKAAAEKELRQELKGMNSAVAANNNGIYLSIGAIVIIILLLILLL
jgi:hypothetical protein